MVVVPMFLPLAKNRDPDSRPAFGGGHRDSVVECFLDTEEATGSIPVSPTNYYNGNLIMFNKKVNN